MVGGTTLQVKNPVEALRNQDGQFRVISPNGYIFQVTCRRGRKIQIREMGQFEPASFPEIWGWQIEKIA